MVKLNNVMAPEDAPEGVDMLAGSDDFPDDLDNFLPIAPPRKVITNPRLDPASPHWDAKRYFDLQPKVLVVIPKNESDLLTDPTGKRKVTQDVGINGYTITITKGRPTYVPQDFATLIRNIDAGEVYGEADDPMTI